MSILLDALRKSENSQRPLEAPTIHVQQQAGVDSETLRKGPMALLILISLIVITWIIWRQYEVPAGSYQPPVAMPTRQEGVIATPPVTSQAASTETGSTVSAGKPATPVTKQQRTPVENYQQAIRNMVKAKGEKPAGDKPVRPAPKSTPASDEPVQTVATTDKTEPVNKQPAPISYWELPDALRANVPVIRFSVLVYASQPDDRFVLINGQRLHEGDSFRPGLVVEEIRRDGVIFSYRLYRFLVER